MAPQVEPVSIGNGGGFWLLAGIFTAVAMSLQGCGGGGSPTPAPPTTTTHTGTTRTTTTITTTTSWATSTLSPGPPPPIPTKDCPPHMQEKMHKVADRYANDPDYKFPVAVGYAGSDHRGGQCAMGYVAYPSSSARDASDNRTGRFVYGSFTKMWTASAVMKLVEAGDVKLDDPPFSYMESAYQKAEGANESLVSIFGPQIKNVTLRQLLSMRGSISDYPADSDPSGADKELQYQKLHPSDDLGPSRSAKMFGSSLNGGKLPLGSCGVYSSMSYVLLGLFLIGQKDVAWDAYDQNIWKEHFPLMKFGIHGTCGNYTDANGRCKGCEPLRVLDLSCTNGFTCGNLIAPPSEVARFVWGLFMGQLLKPETVHKMMDYKPLGPKGATQNQTCGGWCSEGCLYGLGIQAPANTCPTGGEPAENFPGHAGQTYGYTSMSAFDHWRGAAFVAGVADGNIGAGSVWEGLHNALAPVPVPVPPSSKCSNYLCGSPTDPGYGTSCSAHIWWLESEGRIHSAAVAQIKSECPQYCGGCT